MSDGRTHGDGCENENRVKDGRTAAVDGYKGGSGVLLMLYLSSWVKRGIKQLGVRDGRTHKDGYMNEHRV